MKVTRVKLLDLKKVEEKVDHEDNEKIVRWLKFSVSDIIVESSI